MNKERKTINLIVDDIDFQKQDAIDNIIRFNMLNTPTNYEIISVDVSLTLEQKYLITYIVDLF